MLRWITGLLGIVVIIGAGAFIYSRLDTPEPIKIGILHSLSGTMAISEAPVVDAVLLAVEEINAAGGIMGHPIEPIIVDGRSDWQVFATEAERLILDEQVNVIFGCWTSACRKTVRPVFERHNHLLIYPVQYEGLETSPNIIYTGAAPNQQIIPAVKWALDNLGTRFYLVGSDYVFPRTANAIIRDQLTALRGEVVGEEYVLLGSTEVSDIIQDIQAKRPDVILNTINGDSNIAFFQELRAAGISAERIPTISFSIAEGELQSMDTSTMIGDYAAWNYFQSLDRPENQRFVERFRARYGADRVVGDPLEAGYFGVYLWAQAVTEVDSWDVGRVRLAMHDQSFNAPQGVVYIDGDTQHTWKTVRIGQITADGQFNIVWDAQTLLRPQPYPSFRSVNEWQLFLDDLYNGWGQQWANPGT
ncbi:MAG: urea ABC transporter substrate-binding protein [Anaerolineae bacterium]|nr:urea ABC transporter substrate-binding protein [Anaerolineae bacterium]